MKNGFRVGLLLALFAFEAGGCSTVTIREKGLSKISSGPTYEASKPYFLWGLVGEHHIDVSSACNGKVPRQMQAQHTVLDSILSMITFGIYSPRTARIWCSWFKEDKIMKTKLMICSVLAAFSVFSGCSTMYFHNGGKSFTPEMSEWHHDGVLRLVEFSDSVDMNQRCEAKGWDVIKVEKTFVQGLVGSVTYNLYDPWDVSYTCR
jgi:hypothetical protein